MGGQKCHIIPSPKKSLFCSILILKLRTVFYNYVTDCRGNPEYIAETRKLLAKLKDETLPAAMPKSSIHQYDVHWCSKDDKGKVETILCAILCAFVYLFLFIHLFIHFISFP